MAPCPSITASSVFFGRLSKRYSTSPARKSEVTASTAIPFPDRRIPVWPVPINSTLLFFFF